MIRDPHRGAHRLLLLFLVLVTLAAWGPSLGVYFIKDDLSMGVLTGGGHEFDAASWYEQLIVPTGRTHDDIFRPVPPTTWAVDYLLFGPDPFAFHLWNLFWHALNGVLIYWLVNRLTGFRKPLAGFFAGLLFVLYPLHGEAVLWSTQRFVVMGLGLSLLCFLFWDLWLHRRRARDLVLALVTMIACTMTKEIGVTLPAGLVVMALFLGPPRSLGQRVRQASVAIVAGVAWIGAYFAMRYAIFGRLTGGYSGWPTMADYARDNRIFERLPESLLHCAVPVNAAVESMPKGAFWVFAALQVAAVLFAGIRLLNACLVSPRARGLVLLGLTVTATALVPTLWIFQVGADLINGRFGYHPVAFPIVLLAVFLVDPWSDREGRRGLRRSGLLPCATLAVLYAAILQANLGAYDAGGAQVRLIQEALLKEAARNEAETVHAVFDVPHQIQGCPTIDSYLPILTRPPLTRDVILNVAFVQSQAGTWPTHLVEGAGNLSEVRSVGRPEEQPRPVRFYRARPWPPGLVPLFGATELENGDQPATPLAPEDGAVVVNPGSEPVFIWEAPESLSRFRLHLDVPGVSAAWTLEVGRNVQREGRRLSWRFSAGGVVGESPDPWAGITAVGMPSNPLPAQWRVESLDAEGKPVGISRSMRLLVVDDPGRR